MEDGTRRAYLAIEKFKLEFATFPGQSECTLVFPNEHSQPGILWAIYEALSPVDASPPARRGLWFHPGNFLELTAADDGLLTNTTQIGNYGPPEDRCSYDLRVGDQACVATSDNNDFDLVVEENSFRVRARSPEILERVVKVLVDWHAQRDAALIRRVEIPG